MSRQVAVALYIAAMAAIIVGVAVYSLKFNALTELFRMLGERPPAPQSAGGSLS